jgi:hypothetical protein
MGIDPALIARSGFYLYAETFLPDEAARAANLDALQMCADGTASVTPSVSTYVFRPSPLAQLTGDRLHPGCRAIESTELYLTPQGFRGHIETDLFRQGLRKMYREIDRLGARIFWIGARPEPDMLRNIYRSDPEARPVMPVREQLFDAQVHAGCRVEDAVIFSLGMILAPGQGAAAIEAIDALADGMRAISLVAFFHPLDPGLLRLFWLAPVDAAQPPARIAALVAPLAATCERLIGHAQVHRDRPDLAAALETALAGCGEWQAASSGYSGYPLHPAVSTD